jgi:hypothetical protein
MLSFRDKQKIRKQSIIRLVAATVFWLVFTKSFVFIEERYYVTHFKLYLIMLKQFTFKNVLFQCLVLGTAAAKLFLREDSVLRKALPGTIFPFLDIASY